MINADEELGEVEGDDIAPLPPRRPPAETRDALRHARQQRQFTQEDELGDEEVLMAPDAPDRTVDETRRAIAPYAGRKPARGSDRGRARPQRGKRKPTNAKSFQQQDAEDAAERRRLAEEEADDFADAQVRYLTNMMDEDLRQQGRTDGRPLDNFQAIDNPEPLEAQVDAAADDLADRALQLPHLDLPHRRVHIEPNDMPDAAEREADRVRLHQQLGAIDAAIAGPRPRTHDAPRPRRHPGRLPEGRLAPARPGLEGPGHTPAMRGGIADERGAMNPYRETDTDFTYTISSRRRPSQRSITDVISPSWKQPIAGRRSPAELDRALSQISSRRDTAHEPTHLPEARRSAKDNAPAQPQHSQRQQDKGSIASPPDTKGSIPSDSSPVAARHGPAPLPEEGWTAEEHQRLQITTGIYTPLEREFHTQQQAYDALENRYRNMGWLHPNVLATRNDLAVMRATLQDYEDKLRSLSYTPKEIEDIRHNGPPERFAKAEPPKPKESHPMEVLDEIARGYQDINVPKSSSSIAASLKKGMAAMRDIQRVHGRGEDIVINRGRVVGTTTTTPTDELNRFRDRLRELLVGTNDPFARLQLLLGELAEANYPRDQLLNYIQVAIDTFHHFATMYR